MAREKFVKYTPEQLREAIATAICWSDVCRTLNVTICTANYKRFQRLAEENKWSTDHFDVKAAFQRNKTVWTPETVLVENSKAHRCHIRPLLIRFGMYTGLCGECGVSDEWNGKPLTLEVDHINGVCTDNRPENLRWLCPNCHSQTPTFRNRRNE